LEIPTAFRNMVDEMQLEQLEESDSPASSARGAANGRSRDVEAPAATGGRRDGKAAEEALTAGEDRGRAESRSAGRDNGKSKVDGRGKAGTEDSECIPVEDDGDDVDALASQRPVAGKPEGKADKSRRRRPRDVSPSRDSKRGCIGLKEDESPGQRVVIADEDGSEKNPQCSLLSSVGKRVGKGLKAAGCRA
jgi:hypothetical protein